MTDEHATKPAPPKKKPYDPPRILSREPLEMTAGVCTPGKSVQFLCPDGPISS